MLIDGHIHIYPDGKEPRKNVLSKENLVKNLKQYKINKAIILPLEPDISNEFVRDVCMDYPDVFIGFATVNPSIGGRALGLIEEYVCKYKLRGLKLHPRLQQFSLRDPGIVPLFKKCAQLRIPIVVDAFPGTDCVTKESIPLLIEDIATKVPAANIIIAHAGGYKVMDALFAAKNCRNIFLDLSFSLQYFKDSSIEKDITFVVKKLGANRCIYGSDYPQMDMVEALGFMIAFLERNNFSKAEMEYILGGTVVSLLDL